MKNIKRIISVLLVAVIAVCLSVTAFAAMDSNSQKVMDRLNKGITYANGSVFQIPADSLNAAEKYLTTYEGMTSAKSDAIISDIDQAQAIVISEGITDLKQLSSSAKNKIFSLATDAATQVDCHLTYTNGVITVTGPNGEIVYQVNVNGGSNPSSGVIKATGDSTNLIATSFVVVAILAAAVGVVLVRRNNLAKGK